MVTEYMFVSRWGWGFPDLRKHFNLHIATCTHASADTRKVEIATNNLQLVKAQRFQKLVRRRIGTRTTTRHGVPSSGGRFFGPAAETTSLPTAALIGFESYGAFQGSRG